MYIGIKEVAPCRDYRLLVTFENGERRIFDVTPYLDSALFRDLRDPAVFNAVRVHFDTVEWPNGVDLCPEIVYAESQPANQADRPHTVVP